MLPSCASEQQDAPIQIINLRGAGTATIQFRFEWGNKDAVFSFTGRKKNVNKESLVNIWGLILVCHRLWAYTSRCGYPLNIVRAFHILVLYRERLCAIIVALGSSSCFWIVFLWGWNNFISKQSRRPVSSAGKVVTHAVDFHQCNWRWTSRRHLNTKRFHAFRFRIECIHCLNTLDGTRMLCITAPSSSLCQPSALPSSLVYKAAHNDNGVIVAYCARRWCQQRQILQIFKLYINLSTTRRFAGFRLSMVPNRLVNSAVARGAKSRLTMNIARHGGLFRKQPP